jgi:hypothetical protein
MHWWPHRGRRILPEFLDSPLNVGVERLRINFDDIQLGQLLKYPTERWLSRKIYYQISPGLVELYILSATFHKSAPA